MLVEDIVSEKLTWAKSGNKIVRKYRCTSGQRMGRIVSKISQCFAPIDIKKRTQLKKTKARLGGKIARKTKRTKRLNPISKRVRALNKKR